MVFDLGQIKAWNELHDDPSGEAIASWQVSVARPCSRRRQGWASGRLCRLPIIPPLPSLCLRTSWHGLRWFGSRCKCGTWRFPTSGLMVPGGTPSYPAEMPMRRYSPLSKSLLRGERRLDALDHAATPPFVSCVRARGRSIILTFPGFRPFVLSSAASMPAIGDLSDSHQLGLQGLVQFARDLAFRRADGADDGRVRCRTRAVSYVLASHASGSSAAGTVRTTVSGQPATSMHA